MKGGRFMSEFIMGLGISVKICNVYEELVCLTICANEHTLEYIKNIELLEFNKKLSFVSSLMQYLAKK